MRVSVCIPSMATASRCCYRCSLLQGYSTLQSSYYSLIIFLLQETVSLECPHLLSVIVAALLPVPP